VKLDTEFDIYEKVLIVDLGMKADVTGIKLIGLNLFFVVEFWLNGEPRCVDVRESEIDHINRKPMEIA